MTRTWWVKRLVGAPPRPARRTRPAARPALVRLEDRTAPATLTEADAGKTLVITLDETNEALTVVSAGTSYGFTTTGTKFNNGGVTDTGDFTGINTNALTLKASGLTRYDTIRVLDTKSGTKVTFADSGGNAYSDQFQVTLDGGSAGIEFNLASDFGSNPVALSTDATLSVPSGATVSGSGGITVRANAVAIDTSGTPGTVNAGGGTVAFAPFTAGNAIDLGGPDAASTLGLTDAEIDRVTAGVLRVGDATAGAISVTGQITPASVSTLALVSGGAIANTAAGNGVQVTNLALRGSNVNLGTSTFTDVTTLAGTATGAGGGFTFQDNAGSLTVGAVDAETGVTTSGGVVTITAAGDITVSSPVAAGAADINLLAGGGAGLVNQSSIGNSGGHTIILRADAQDLQVGSTVVAAGGTVNLRANTGGVAADLGSAAAGFNFSAAELGTVTAAVLRVTASAGINVSDNITLSAAQVPALSLDAVGAVTQAAGKVLSVSKLAASGSSVALDTGSHLVGTVAGKATAGNFAVLSASPPGLTVGTVDGVAGVTASGSVTIRSANDLTVAAAVTAGTTVALTVADGGAVGHTATVPGSFLTAPGDTTITGGAGSDTFNVTASANSKISVDGGNPALPTTPGDTLTIDAQFQTAAVKYKGPDLTKGTVTVAALDPIAFKNIETLKVQNALGTETVLDGTAGDDVVVLEKVSGVTQFTLNGGAPLPVIGTKFTFNGSDGNDRLLVKFANGGPGLTQVTFDGGTGTDILQIDAAGLDGSYRPGGADSGTVTVGGQPVGFTTAEQVDATAAGTFSVVFPGADDAATVADGKDFASNSFDALVVSSPTAAFAPVALWNNTTVAIDTADAGGTDGNDTVTITSADNAHGNASLTVRTGAGTDTVTVNGPVVVSGSFAVNSVAVAVNAKVTAGNTATLTHTGLLQLGAVTVSGANGVTETGGGAVALTGDAAATSAAGGVSFGGAVDAAVAGGQSLTVTAATAATLSKSAGQTTRLKSLSVTGALIALGGSNYKTDLDQTYTGAAAVSAAAALFDSATGAVTFAGTLDGASAGTSGVTIAAAGAVTFAQAVGGATALQSLTAGGASVAVNGGLVKTTQGQTYNAPVTVGQDTAFTATGGGAVAFNDTLSGAFAVSVNTTGATTFAKAVNVGTLSTDAGGTTAVNGGSVTTAGGQSYGDAVAVGADATFASTGGGDVVFGGSLDGGFKVVINTAGTAKLNGPVGGGSPLASLTTDAGGTTQVLGGLVKTSGGQTYNDPVTVGVDATFASTGAGAITFNAALDGPGSASVATAGATTFKAAVGGGTALGSLATDAGGTTAVNGGLVKTAGGQSFNDPVTLGANTQFTSAAGGTVRFFGTLSGPFDATVQTAGGTEFDGAVNVGTLTTDAGGTTTVRTTAVTTAGAQTFGDGVSLQPPPDTAVTFRSTGGKDVTFAAAIGGPGALVADTAGTTTFGGPVGAVSPLASLVTTGGGTTVVGGGLVKTAGGQEYGDAVSLAADAAFAAGAEVRFDQTLTAGFAVVVSAPAVSFLGAVSVNQLSVTPSASGGVVVAGPTVTTTLGQLYGNPVTVTGDAVFKSFTGDVTFGGSLGGGFKVTVLSPGTTTFGGVVNVGTLTTDAGGTTAVLGGLVQTAADQTFGDAVTVAGPDAAFTSTGGGNVTFASTLTGGVKVQVNTAGLGVFNAPVSVGALSTDALGTTVVNTALVDAATDLTFRDAVVANVPTTFQAGGDALFLSSLTGAVAVSVLNPGTTTFGGPVNLQALATDAPGQTAVNGGAVATAGAQSFGDPVTLGADAVFTSTLDAVVFASSLTGPGRAVAVNAPAATVFGGPVRVGSLATDAAGSTQVNSGSVVTDGSQAFHDPVAVGAAATFAAGDQVLFFQSLTGPVAVAVNAPGSTLFGGPVGLGSLTTDAPGVTVVDTAQVATSGAQDFGDGVSVGVSATFSGAAITFRSALVGGVAVGLASGGDVTFFGAVNVGALSTDAGGRTVIRGGSVTTAAAQSYGDAVVLGATAGLTSSGGDLIFGGSVDPEAAGGQGLVAAAPAGTVLFAGPAGATGPLGFLSTDAVTTRFAADVRSAGDVALTGRGGGVDQAAGFLTAPTLGLFGAGAFALDQLGSGPDGNDITGTFRADIAGTIKLADRNSLTVDPAGIVTRGGDVTLRTGSDFTATDPRAGAARYSTPLVNVGGGQFVVDPGHFGPAVVTFDAEIDPGQAVFGLPGGANNFGDQFRIRPSAFIPIQVNGNAPNSPLPPGVSPDQLTPLFAGGHVIGFTYDGSNGQYTFSDRQPLSFTGIDSLAGRALAGFVVQTGEPRDATGSVQIQYAVRIVQTQQVQALVDGKLVQTQAPVPLPGGLDGHALLQNPFVVAPALVNPTSTSAAPRIAFGDVNGDGQPDLILANGPGTAPLVTVIDGRAINAQADLTLRKLEDLQQQGMILAQFYAYDPRFQGGVNVTAADLDGDGRAEVITGAEQGGGPHVRVFNLAKGADVGFFVYEPTFTGGVRVATGDVTGDGVPDLVLGAGVGGGPRVTVIDGKTLAATGNRVEVANFFAYDNTFRGGIYVDAGDYNGDGRADILTGPGRGGAAHIRVFDGATAVGGGTPVELAGFFAFPPTNLENPLFSAGVPVDGVGGVAFSGVSVTGSRNILVGTGRGRPVEVVEFGGNGGNPTTSADLLKDAQFLVQGVNPETHVQNPVILPLPGVLNYGASVGGFADPFVG